MLAAVESREVQAFEIEQPVPRPARPAPPRRAAVFKIMMRKHALVAWKRRRLFTAIWPAVIYSGVEVGLYYALGELQQSGLRTTFMAVVGPTYVSFAIMAAMNCVIVEVVSEKESKMKIMQEIYGLTSFMYWATWIAYFAVVSVAAMAVIIIALTQVAPLVAAANRLLVLLIFALAYIVHFEFATGVAVLFDRVGTASSAASLLGVAMSLLSASLQGFLRGKAKPLWYLAGLLPTTAFFNAFSSAVWLESFYACEQGHCQELGLSLGNLWSSKLCAVPESPCPNGAVEVFPAGEALLLLLFDTLLYGFLSWWIENVWQGEYGAAKPFFFCLNPAFLGAWWRPRNEGGESLLDVEGGSQGRTVSMSISNLRKVFKDRVAVDDLSLDFFTGEIFALLGHNGAGKTTAINCVVGLVPPTSGSALVNGCDVRTDVEGVRRQLTVCPQDNPLYDVFTVRQHLAFFASLRGVSEGLVEDRIMEVLTALGMPEKATDLCSSLSGGQKRRLWVATALLGETPLIFLDEPTSGMDPASRRDLWSLLLRMRSAGSTIIFTTHYLEEADILADRKAVLAKGRVQAVGTSQDLKTQFGLGYHLLVAFQASATEHSVSELQTLVVRHVATAEHEPQAAGDAGSNGETGHLARFVLPYQEDRHIGPLLLELDARKAELRVQGYSLETTSLEEVFMALGQQVEAGSGDGEAAAPGADFHEIPPEEVEPLEAPPQRSGARAVLRMRLQLLWNDRRGCCSAVLMPPVILLLSFVLYDDDTGYNAAVYPPCAFCMPTILFAKHLVKEKQAKCKYAVVAQGLSTKSFWLGTMAAHYLTYLPMALEFVAILVFKPPEVLPEAGLPLILLMALLYPLLLLLYTYNFCLLFETVEMAAKVIPITNMLLGVLPPVGIMLLRVVPKELADGVYAKVADGAHTAMCLLNPLYGLSGVLIYLINSDASALGNFATRAALPLYCSLLSCIFMAVHLWWRERRGLAAAPGSAQDGGDEEKDEDVLEEERRVRQEAGPDEAVRYLQLMHTYRTKVSGQWQETAAVRGISLGVRNGECFGLLGPNGAGKTTTLSVLTGDVRPPSSGSILVCGHDIASPLGLAAARRCLGVCPQIDPLWDQLTGRQHLKFLGRIKGVPEAVLDSTAENLFSRLGFQSADLDKVAETYSGGMKRKLSLGMALVGQSRLLFLDEPSAAVDAAAKRQLWRVIKRRRREQTVVLTTHSMEEAEGLCDRIAIQVQGQLRCLGSPLRLKQKYGSGYQLEIFRQQRGAPAQELPESQDEVVQFVHGKLTPKATLLERHAGRYLFQLPGLEEGGGLSLGSVFSEVAKSKEAADISDFSINQPSLEQVFLRFAREQDDAQPEEAPEQPSVPAASERPAEPGGEPGQRTPFLAA